MLFKGVLLTSLLGSCFSQWFWDPEDPRCEEVRQSQKSWWDSELLFSGVGNNRFQRLLEKGCNEYEEVKQNEDYRCWPNGFLCASMKALEAKAEGKRLKDNYVHQPWYIKFEKVGNHQRDDRDEEIQWVVDMRWNDPKLLFWNKNDLENIGNNMFDRIFFYVEQNNIDSLQLIFDQYNTSVMDFMREDCVRVGNDVNEMQCKLAAVFDTLVGLMIDNKNINWRPSRDSNPPRNREELSMLYLLEPRVYIIMNLEEDPRNKTLCYRLMTMFQSFFDNVLDKDGPKIKEHFGRFGSVHVMLRDACNKTYENNFDNIVCYIAETFFRMNKLTTALGPDYNNWQSSSSKSMRAVVLIWHLLTPKGNFYVKANATKRGQSAIELLKIMYTKIKGNEIDDLQEISSLIPNEEQMGLTSSELCAPDFERIRNDLKCAFRIVLENLSVFLGQYKSKDRRTKRIDLSVNYKTRLQQFQISSIKDTVENTKLELKNSLEEFTSDLKQYMEASMGNRFQSLQTYFETMASFDLDIAQADTVFITGKLDEFTKTSRELNEQLEYDSSQLQLQGTIIKSIDVAFMWIKAIGSGIDAVLGILEGDFEGFADTADLIDAAARATLEAVKGGAIAEQIEMSTIKFKEIANGFQETRKQLEHAKSIIEKLKENDVSSDEFKQISKEFIKCYNDFTPKVDAAQIAELDTAWNLVVDNLEELIDSMETAQGIAAATVYFVNNHFFKIKLVVPQLSETLSNRFDFQMDLMDSLAATVRAHTSLKGAEGLSQGFPSLEEQLEKSIEIQLVLQQMALSTYILSQFHLLLILSQYCNYVTYVNAGVESSQCTRALTTMNTVHVDDALSFSSPSCDRVDVSLRIPTSDSGISENINLHQLNSGKEVLFRIPDFEWLQSNGEISPEDENSALFVKRFELYAFTNNSYEINTNLRVTTTPAGPSPLYLGSDQTKYEFLPVSRTQYVFEYKENVRGNCNAENNPYFVCRPGPEEICVQSRGEIENDLGAYPSIYSPWIIKLDKNIGNSPITAPGTKLYLQAKLQLCRKRKDSNERPRPAKKRFLKKMKQRKHRLFKDANTQACPAGMYFNQELAQFVACPAGSTPQRFNYYCEVNKNGG